MSDLIVGAGSEAGAVICGVWEELGCVRSVVVGCGLFVLLPEGVDDVFPLV